MRSDIPSALAAALADDGAEPIQYLVVKFPPEQGGYQYLSDRDYEYSEGLYCDPLVVSWGQQVENLGSPVTIYDQLIVAREHSLTILNTEATGWWLTYLNSGEQGVEVEVWQAAAGIADQLLIDSYIIRTPLKCSSASPYINITLTTPLQATNPAVGLPDGRGGRYPLACGRAYVAGRLHGKLPVAKLSSSAEKGETVLSADRDLQAAGWPSTGQIEINGEEYLYSGIDGPTFKNVKVAGFPAGTSKFHNSGEWITDPDTVYEFGICEPFDDYSGAKVYAGGSPISSSKWINADGLLLVRFDSGRPPSRYFEDSEQVTGTITLQNGSGINLTEQVDPSREAHISSYVDKDESGWPKYDAVYIDGGDWANNEIAYTDSSFGYTIPDDAFDFHAELFLKYVAFQKIQGIIPVDERKYVYIEGKLFGIGYSKSFSLDKTIVSELKTSYDKASVIQGKNYLKFYVNYAEDKSESRIVFGLEHFYIDYSYYVYKDGYPKTEYYLDDGGVAADVWTSSSYRIHVVDAIDYILGKKGLSLEPVSKEAVRALHSAQGYYFKGVIEGNRLANDVLNDMLVQSRCRLIENGSKIYIRQNEILDESDALAEYSEDDFSFDSLLFTQPDLTSCVNSAIIKYDVSNGKYQSEKKSDSADEIEKYGLQQKVIDGYLIYEDAHAQSIADWVLEENKSPPLLMDAAVYLSEIGIEVGDKVSVTTDYSGILYYKGVVAGIKRLFASFTTVNKLQLTIRARQWRAGLVAYLTAKTMLVGSGALVSTGRVILSAKTMLVGSGVLTGVKTVFLTSKTLLAGSGILASSGKAVLTSKTMLVGSGTIETMTGGYGYEPEGAGYFPWGT